MLPKETRDLTANQTNQSPPPLSKAAKARHSAPWPICTSRITMPKRARVFALLGGTIATARGLTLAPRSWRRSLLMQSRRSQSLLEGQSPRRVSLADLVSSPERYASSLNMTADEVIATKSAHLAAAQELHELMTSPDSSLEAAEKNILRCRHRLKFGHHPFVCRKCWSYMPICVCSAIATTPRLLPQGRETMRIHLRLWEAGVWVISCGYLYACQLTIQPFTFI